MSVQRVFLGMMIDYENIFRNINSKITCETSLGRPSFRIKNWIDTVETAWREPIVIPLVTRRCASKHDEITVISTRSADFRIMLKKKATLLIFKKTFNIIFNEKKKEFNRYSQSACRNEIFLQESGEAFE